MVEKKPDVACSHLRKPKNGFWSIVIQNRSVDVLRLAKCPKLLLSPLVTSKVALVNQQLPLPWRRV